MTDKRARIQERIDEFSRKGWWGGQTLSDLFEDVVAKYPDRLALIDQPNRSEWLAGEAKRLTWAELQDEVEACAAALDSLGIGVGDTLVVQLPNVTEFVILYLAVAHLGAIISPLPVQYGHHELGQITGQLQPDLFVGATRVGKNDLRGVMKSGQCGALAWLGEDVPEGDHDLAAVIAGFRGRKEAVPPRAAIDANDVYTVCWTSGTTGTPKGVPRTHNMWTAIARATYEAALMEDGDVLLNPFPFVNMASIGGFLVNWLHCGGTMVLHHPLDLPVFLGQVQQERVTFTIAPPALLNMLLKNEELMAQFDLSSLRTIASGSAPLSPWMVQGFADKYDIGVVNLFGSNEGVCLVSSTTDMPDASQRATYFPRFGVEGIEWSASVSKMIRTRLRDLESGEIATRPGSVGELELWGATVIDHYLGQEPGDPSVFTEDGYFRSGDLFEIAGNEEPPRFYRFVGRSKDIIIRGGFNISPEELDIALAAHPKLAEAATVGCPDPDLGERVCVFIVPKPAQTVELSDITSFLTEQGFARFKLPERLETVDQLPRNALGKVVRTELRSQL